MIKRRIAWGIIIIAAGIAYLFSNETVTLALLIACVAVPLFSGIMLAASGRKLKIRLETSGESEAGSFRVIIENGSILPVSGAQVETACSNLRTGEVQKAAAEGYVKAKGETKIPVNIVPVHSGRYEMSIGDVFLYDPLKLFRKKAEAEGKAGFTFAKDLFDTELKIVSSSS
ncbi:MAG: hypothetical protein Q4A48_08035, partial [Bacillota bacterium]|nr:hypothetical protein [Bacillota bacterium]